MQGSRTPQHTCSWQGADAAAAPVLQPRALPCRPYQVWFASMAAATCLGALPSMPQIPLIPASWEQRLGGTWRARLLLGAPVYLAGLAINAWAKQDMIKACASMGISKGGSTHIGGFRVIRQGHNGGSNDDMSDRASSRRDISTTYHDDVWGSNTSNIITSSSGSGSGSGHGTPVPLCTGGIFQWTRNPVYLAALCLTTGAGLLANSACFVAASTVPFFAYCQVAQCPAEEALMLQLYGEQYRRYCAHVPRWWAVYPR